MPDSGSAATPIEVPTDEINASGEVPILRLDGEGGQSVILQRTPALLSAADSVRQPEEASYCGVIPAGASVEQYEIDRLSNRPAAFSLVDRNGRLEVKEGQQSVFAYNYGMQLPEGVPPEYERSSYIHPVWDLEGTIVTDDFPEDHYHHRGISWMWPRVFVDGAEYDLWALRGMEQVFDTWLMREAGPACATIGVKNHWELTEDGRNIVDEWVWMRAYPAGTHGRAIDIRITLEANEPVEIAGRETDDKGYGGFSVRFGPREGTVITSNEGRETSDSDHKRLPWADESGLFRNAPARSGIAVFQHSSHPDFPAQWTLRHYGFIGVAWPSLSRIRLEPGRPVTLRYRLWVHRGGAAQGRVANAYDMFRHPPVLEGSE